jgi:hypothetical protein
MQSIVTLKWFDREVLCELIKSQGNTTIIRTNEKIDEKKCMFNWVPSSIYQKRIEGFQCYKVIPVVFESNISSPAQEEIDWIKNKVLTTNSESISDMTMLVNLSIFESKLNKKLHSYFVKKIIFDTANELKELIAEQNRKREELIEFQLNQLPF